MRRLIAIGGLILSGVALAGCAGQSAQSTSSSAAPSVTASVPTTASGQAVASSNPASAQPSASVHATATLDPAKVKEIEASAQANPKDAAAQLALGDVYFITKDYAKAIAAYEAVVKLTPKDAAAWTALGAAAYNAGDAERAVEALLTAVKRDPNSQEAHYDLAFAYQALSPPKTDEAKSALQRAIDLDPKSAIGAAAQDTLDSIG
jgi:tetratricopeptide (TPR) repeat protein